MSKKILYFIAAFAVVLALVPTAVYAQTETAPAGGDLQARCDRWADRLSDVLGRLNDIKLNKIDRYDSATDQIIALTDKYIDGSGSDIDLAAQKLNDDALVLKDMVSGTDGVSDWYYDVIGEIERAQSAVVNCDSKETIDEHMGLVREAWDNFGIQRQEVRDYWTSAVRPDLEALRDAVKGSE